MIIRGNYIISTEICHITFKLTQNKYIKTSGKINIFTHNYLILAFLVPAFFGIWPFW